MNRLSGAPDVLDARQQALHDAIASGPRGRVAGPLALWLHSPELCARAQALGEHLRFNNVFEKRLSEAAILMIAAHHRCEFEWYVHAPIAQKADLPATVIAAIQNRRRPDDMDDDLATVYDFVASLLETNRVPDALYSAFRDRFGAVGIVELTALMGYYQIGAHLLNANELLPEGWTPVFERQDG